MIKNNISVGIDIGTNTTRVVIINYSKENREPEVLAIGFSDNKGMRLGYITNTDQVAESVKKAVKQAENASGVKIHKAYISIGGINLTSTVSTGSVIISRADNEITELDVAKALDSSEENLDIVNKKIVHIIPISYKLDSKDIYGRPEGMHGVKLEAKTLFVTCLKQNIEDLITVLAIAKIEIIDIIASPVASAMVLIGTKQKNVGSALLDIGAETSTIAVFEDNLLISLQVFPIGSMDITKDIALGFRISLEEAESIKHGSIIGGNYPQKKVDEIIEARLGDMFELVENHLKRLRRNELLPAGIIITGGGSNINNIEEIARAQLKLPARTGPTDPSINNKFKVRDTSWYTALGLALSSNEEFVNNNIRNIIGDNLKQVKGFFKSILSQLIP